MGQREPLERLVLTGRRVPQVLQVPQVLMVAAERSV
jgi:hypothetical protein